MPALLTTTSGAPKLSSTPSTAASSDTEARNTAHDPSGPYRRQHGRHDHVDDADAVTGVERSERDRQPEALSPAGDEHRALTPPSVPSP